MITFDQFKKALLRENLIPRIDDRYIPESVNVQPDQVTLTWVDENDWVYEVVVLEEDWENAKFHTGGTREYVELKECEDVCGPERDLSIYFFRPARLEEVFGEEEGS